MAVKTVQKTPANGHSVLNTPAPRFIDTITGIIHVTGEPDTGKTGFALSCGYQPHEMFIVDDDIKTRASLERAAGGRDVLQMFPMYHDFIRETQGQLELATHAMGLDLIDKAIEQQPKVIIWDTWTRFAKTCHPFVVANASKFKQFWTGTGAMKGAEQWNTAFAYEATLYQKMLRAAPLVILVTHLKDHNINGVKTGKQIPDAQRPLLQKCTLRLFLRHNPESAAPIGLVLKRIEKWHIDENGMRMVSVLPRRLNPCTWAKIREYWDNPIGDRAPTKDETPNAFELSILDATLTKDQQDMFKISAARASDDESADTIDLPTTAQRDERAEFARQLRKDGEQSIMSIAKQVTEKFGGDKVLPAHVAKWLQV